LDLKIIEIIDIGIKISKLGRLIEEGELKHIKRTLSTIPNYMLLTYNSCTGGYIVIFTYVLAIYLG
jgi:hypothetical protein